jgi:hypothetical protein
MGRLAAVKVMSGFLVPSITLWAPSSASSLWVTLVWDLTFSMSVVYSRSSLVWMMLSAM